MALLHQATVRPTKAELLAGWLPRRGWYRGPAGPVHRLASFRFDDPAGAVGVETALVQVDAGPTYQAPLTYRDAPLPGAQEWLLGTAEHSVLGTRWIYDATADPVYLATLAAAILTNTGQAEQLIEVDGQLQRRAPSMHIAGAATQVTSVPTIGAIVRLIDGDDHTLIVTDTLELTVVRRLDLDLEVTGATLTGTWPGQPTPRPLATATLR